MYQIISLPMAEAQKQPRRGSANSGRWDLYKLWAEVPAVHSVWAHEGEITPSFGFVFEKNTFSDVHKGDKSYHLSKGEPVPEHRYLRTHCWNFQVWPFWTLKLRELLLDYPRIFSLASDVGIPILGQGQAAGTWERSGHSSSQRGSTWN